MARRTAKISGLRGQDRNPERAVAARFDERPSARSSRLQPRAEFSAASAPERSRAGLRTIVVTHNLDQAPLLGDWAIRLEKGAVADQGPTAEVVARTSLAPEVTGS